KISPNWYTNLELIYEGKPLEPDYPKLNDPGLYELLNQMGFDFFTYRSGDFITFLNYSIAEIGRQGGTHNYEQRVREWYDRILRALIICCWYRNVGVGPLNAWQKLELFWETYCRGSELSNFPDTQSLLNYWMTLPFTIMSPEFRTSNFQLDTHVTFADLGCTFLQFEVQVWGQKIQELGDFWRSWSQHCQR